MVEQTQTGTKLFPEIADFGTLKTKEGVLDLLEKLIEKERAERRREGKSERGSIQIAVNRLCVMARKSKAWGNQYACLCHLDKELVKLLDLKDINKRLNFGSAFQLSRLPTDLQIPTYKESEGAFISGGHRARTAFLLQQVTLFRAQKGIKPMGRRVNDRRRLIKCSAELRKLSDRMACGRNDTEYPLYLNKTLKTLNSDELAQLLLNLETGIMRFVLLLETANLSILQMGGAVMQDAKSERPAQTVKQQKPPESQADRPSVSSVNPPVLKVAVRAPVKVAVTGRSTWPSYTSDPDQFEADKGKSSSNIGWVSRKIKGRQY
jgi:hypothetical protein